MYVTHISRWTTSFLPSLSLVNPTSTYDTPAILCLLPDLDPCLSARSISLTIRKQLAWRWPQSWPRPSSCSSPGRPGATLTSSTSGGPRSPARSRLPSDVSVSTYKLYMAAPTFQRLYVGKCCSECLPFSPGDLTPKTVDSTSLSLRCPMFECHAPSTDCFEKACPCRVRSDAGLRHTPVSPHTPSEVVWPVSFFPSRLTRPEVRTLPFWPQTLRAPHFERRMNPHARSKTKHDA